MSHVNWIKEKPNINEHFIFYSIRIDQQTTTMHWSNAIKWLPSRQVKGVASTQLFLVISKKPNQQTMKQNKSHFIFINAYIRSSHYKVTWYRKQNSWLKFVTKGQIRRNFWKGESTNLCNSFGKNESKFVSTPKRTYH